MERYELKNDVKTICVNARSFPAGIREAFTQLEKAIPAVAERVFYGISKKDEKNNILYKAAVSEKFDGEAKKYGFENFVILKGLYLVEMVKDWRKDPMSIGSSFDKLLSDPLLDESFPCIECYDNMDEVVCMVKLDPTKLEFNF